ncbi:MAG: DNA repair protein RadC [Alphaproteobacteria bacterium]
MTTNNYQEGHRERIREKFEKDFGKTMADYELLEILLTAYLPRKDVKPLAKDLISKFGSISAVVTAPLKELTKVSGVGEVVATNLRVVGAVSGRSAWQKLSDNNKTIISNWYDLIDYCTLTMAHSKIEIFKVVLLDSVGKVIAEEIVQTGTVDSVHVYVRELTKIVLDTGAKSIVLVHNHPSGNPSPSDDDVNLTRSIISSLKGLDISVWDHLIICDGNYFSFKEKGMLSKF